MKPAMFHEKTTWMHYIGKQYSVGSFLREARKYGISRRIPARVARSMSYGDNVILLRWKDPTMPSRIGAYAFAEMEVDGIILSGDIAQAVGEKLVEEGKAESVSGGGTISRECGSYVIEGGWKVNADIPEIVGLAKKISQDDKLFVMITGHITVVYDAPQPVEEVKFARGFIRAEINYLPQPVGSQSKVIAISNYTRS